MSPMGFEPTISAGERPQTARPLGPALSVVLLYVNKIIVTMIYYVFRPVWVIFRLLQNVTWSLTLREERKLRAFENRTW